MDEDELRAFLNELDTQAERLFHASGEHPPLAVIALTQTVVQILLAGAGDSDTAKAAIRRLFERAAAEGARAIGFIHEAWMATSETGFGPEAPPPSAHPNRKEILVLTAASSTAALAAFYPIVREGEAVVLGARVDVPRKNKQYNRFLDRLPWSAKWN